MSSNIVVLIKLLFGLLCDVTVGYLIVWTSIAANIFGEINETLLNGKALALSRAVMIVLALILTWGLAWIKVGVVSWIKVLGWGVILISVLSPVLGVVMGGEIELIVVWEFVIGAAWVGAWSLLSAKSQLLLAFSELHAILILVGTGVFGLIVGVLWRLMRLSIP